MNIEDLRNLIYKHLGYYNTIDNKYIDLLNEIKKTLTLDKK